MADGPPTRRQRKAEARRQAILEAASEVFAAKGFARATTREIADRADVAEGTIYNYFSSKRDLLVAMTRHMVADSVGMALEAFQTQDDRTYLSMLLQERFAFQQRNLAFLRALMSEVWTNEDFRRHYLGEVVAPLLQLMEGYVQARIQVGSVRPVNTSIVVRAMAGSFLIFLLLSGPGSAGLDVDVSHQELVDELVDFFLLGLRAQPEQ
jgi:AcrR family transcriptional regulator